jgi:hypothetical protein
MDNTAQIAALEAALASLKAPAPVPEAAPESTRPERVIVKPPKDSRLEALMCEFAMRQKAAQDAAQKFKELKEGIAAELEALYPEEIRPTEAFEIPGTFMYDAITMNYKSEPYLPAAAIREHLPQVYDAFKKFKVYSEIRVSQRGKGRPRR